MHKNNSNHHFKTTQTWYVSHTISIQECKNHNTLYQTWNSPLKQNKSYLLQMIIISWFEFQYWSRVTTTFLSVEKHAKAKWIFLTKTTSITWCKLRLLWGGVGEPNPRQKDVLDSKLSLRCVLILLKNVRCCCHLFIDVVQLATLKGGGSS